MYMTWTKKTIDATIFMLDVNKTFIIHRCKQVSVVVSIQ